MRQGKFTLANSQAFLNAVGNNISEIAKRDYARYHFPTICLILHQVSPIDFIISLIASRWGYGPTAGGDNVMSEVNEMLTWITARFTARRFLPIPPTPVDLL